MNDLTDEQKAEYFRRSYVSVDGLWFMKTEEKYGFDAALELDRAVWMVLPKIQARMLRNMLDLDCGLEGLQEAIRTRLSLEGFEFETKSEDHFILAIIHRCPWHDLLIKSGREGISERVGDLICGLENSIWASEFGGMRFERMERICQGAEKCVMRFGDV